MPLAADFMDIGIASEEAIRLGDTIKVFSVGGINAVSTQSTTTVIGGPNQETIYELATASANGSVSSVIFSISTELDRTYLLYNISSTPVNVFPPVSSTSGPAIALGNFNGGTAGVSFSLTGNKAAYVTRISSTRWIYTLSA